MVLNPTSANSATAEQISPNEVRLHDGNEEAVLGIVTTADGRNSWNYRINNGIKKSSL
jgi:hypothetical protein